VNTGGLNFPFPPNRPPLLEVYPHEVQYGTRRAQRRAVRRHNLDPMRAHGPEGLMKRQALISAFHEFQNDFVPPHKEPRWRKNLPKPTHSGIRTNESSCAVCIHASLLAHERLGGFYSCSVLRSLSVRSRCPEDMNILTPKKGGGGPFRQVPKYKLAIFSKKGNNHFDYISMHCEDDLPE
jgi:hypothetical protein